ncbi:MAG: peptidase [Alphaproteobacteria bacterium]|nr:peptidase [Alphaproteobacteria bacterium]
MTYCVGVAVEAGLVFAGDRRTNAGPDHISEFRKLTVFEQPGERVLVLLSAGNLAVTQATVAMLQESASRESAESLMKAPSMFRAARLVGNVLREVHRVDGEALDEHNIGFNAGFVLGGQIAGEPPRLFQIYKEGNFIEATVDTPFLQIGETKYGKPVLDRLIRVSASLAETAKCVLVSYSPTLKSNVSVGLPIDLVCYRKDSLKLTCRTTIGTDDPYFQSLTTAWDVGIAALFRSLPDPEVG